MNHYIKVIGTAFLLAVLAGRSTGALDWRQLDPFDEKSQIRKGFQSGELLDAGAWGAKTFPLLAKEIWYNNIHVQKKIIYPLTPYQMRWLGPWLEKWGVDPNSIQIVYEADLLNNYMILDRWPIKIMDELAGQVFGNTIYLKQNYKSKDGNLLVLLSHECYHIKQFQTLGSISEFGREYVRGYVSAFFSYENNPMEIAAFEAQEAFREWLCEQEGWSCE